MGLIKQQQHRAKHQSREAELCIERDPQPTAIAKATPASSVLPRCPQNTKLVNPIRKLIDWDINWSTEMSMRTPNTCCFASRGYGSLSWKAVACSGGGGRFLRVPERPRCLQTRRVFDACHIFLSRNYELSRQETVGHPGCLMV